MESSSLYQYQNERDLSYSFGCFSFYGLCGYFYTTNRPEYLASKSEYIPTFFSLPKEDFTNLGNQFCIDEFQSQGRRFEDFGSAHYVLKISDLHPNIRDVMMKNPNTIQPDSSLILTIKRGDILGSM